MKRRIVTIALALAMLATMAACGGASPAASTAPAAQGGQSAASAAPAPASSGPITLSVFQYELENQQPDFDNLWFYQELEKETGIKIDWRPVKDGDWKTKLNLMFASMDLPDIISRGEVDIEEYGVAQGLLVALDEYLPENMPNYYSRLSMNDSNAAIPASDGKSYWIGNLTAQNVNHDGNHYINKAWLDELGLQIPKTIDELTEVLRAFKTKGPDIIPFSGADLVHQTQGLYTHFANFGVPLNQFVYATIQDDNTLIFPAYLPGFRAACEWLNMCYNEGLLDKESITQDSNVWGTKMNSGLVGYTTYLRLINTALTPETTEQFVSILPPASEFGVKVPRILEVPSKGAMLTINNKHIPESLQWLDAQMETERMMVSVNGPIHEGGPIEPTMLINADGKYEIKYIPEDNGLYKYVPVYHGMFFAPGDYYFDIFEMPPHRVERFESSKMYEDAGVLEKNSYYYLYRLIKMGSDESIERERIHNDLEKFMKESLAKFISKGVTDAEWDKFLSDAKAIGADRYVALYQDAYDAYLAANK